MATEKKAAAPSQSVEQRLKTLYQLQSILTEVDRIRNIRGELPLEVKDLSDTITGLHSRVARFQAEIEDLNAQRIAEKNKIANKKLNIERWDEQLKNVRNNHEFENLNKEIEYEKLQIQLAEKTIGEIERSIDNHKRDIEDTQVQIDLQQNILNEKKDELETIVSETRTQEENLMVKAKALEEQMDDPRLLAAFKRIRHNARNGLGIVMVDRNACGGCFNRIPPQKQIEIKMHKKVIVCEYCGRIMIDPEFAAEITTEK